jgi:hypothetical protein
MNEIIPATKIVKLKGMGVLRAMIEAALIMKPHITRNR